jgi:hypothetical protein
MSRGRYRGSAVLEQLFSSIDRAKVCPHGKGCKTTPSGWKVEREGKSVPDLRSGKEPGCLPIYDLR